MRGVLWWFRACHSPGILRRPCCFLCRSAKCKPALTPYQGSRKWESSYSWKAANTRSDQNLASRSWIAGLGHEQSNPFDSAHAVLRLSSLMGCNKLAFVLIFFFSCSILVILESDLICVRLLLNCCALDYVIQQDVVLEKKQALSTASHIEEFSSPIPDTHWFSEDDKKKKKLPAFLSSLGWPVCSA